jgi:hypothetical protein
LNVKKTLNFQKKPSPSWYSPESLHGSSTEFG